MGGEERVHRWIGRDGEFCSKRSGPDGVWLDKSGEMQGRVRGGKLTPDAEMIFAEGSTAEDGNPDWRGVGHAGRYLPATVRRQRE